MKKTNRDLILTVIVIALIGWLVLRHFLSDNQTPTRTGNPPASSAVSR